MTSMNVTFSTSALTATKADIAVLGVPSADAARTKVLKAIARVTEGANLVDVAADEGFEGQVGQSLKVAVAGQIAARSVLFVGVGEGGSQASAARAIGVALGRACKQHTSAAIELRTVDTSTVQALVEGVASGLYRYTAYRTGAAKSDVPKLKSLTIVGAKSTRELAQAVATAQAIATSVNMARDLVNQPPNDLNPVTFANIASAEAKRANVTCQVWNKKRIEREKMELFLAVNRGSDIEPRLMHLTYKPARAVAKVVFVGKGLTFDSGGLCIKPGKSMETMKCDMAGAATTLGIVLAAARLKLPVEVHGVIGSTENMTGGSAYRPGDVYTSLQGKTVEVINTDAEGRMVLADVLTWVARTLKPDVMIDHATLTGACMVALGQYRAGLYTSDDALAVAYASAADDADEDFWRMPLDEALRPSLKSSIADLKHVGGAYGGSITAALFLREFVEGAKWMHLDIAGPSFLDGTHKHMPKGGTGFGVGTGVRYLASLAASGAAKTTTPKRKAPASKKK